MKKGVEYAHSEEKRQFDRHHLHFIRPFALAAQRAIALSSDADPIFFQTRVGADGDLFNAYKLRTLVGDTKEPVSEAAAFMRRSGLDELIQYKNILIGDMSVVGRRPLTPQEYNRAFDDVPLSTVDEYLELVVPTRPGLVSSFAISTHLGDIEIEDHAIRLKRLEMDIQDVKDGSYKNDMRLFWSAVGKGLGNRMTEGDIQPKEVA